MMLAAVALAASINNLDHKTERPPNIAIAVAPDGIVTITADGKPISCAQLNLWSAKFTKPPHKQTLDCKLLKTKLDR